jgi:pimeloyl-ACP methyl ester carboxylesterase
MCAQDMNLSTLATRPWRRALCTAGLTAALAVQAQSLPRRADIGLSMVPKAGGFEVGQVRSPSAAQQHGLASGDRVLSINGVPADSPQFRPVYRSLREGAPVTIEVQRGERRIEARFVAPAMPQERIEGVRVEYTEVRRGGGAGGPRARVIVSTPLQPGRWPLVFFVPWLSCASVETPVGDGDGWARMLRDVGRDSGAVMVRVDKPGAGDSDGNCSTSDLADDLDTYRAALKQALARPDVDPRRLVLFGGSIGASLAPLLAREFPARALIAAGGYAGTWGEHMMGLERRRLDLLGTSPADAAAAMRSFLTVYAEVLNAGKTPAEATRGTPHARWWYDAPDGQYGRSARYYQQVQALDVDAAWAEVSAPVLLVHGEYDWIMSIDDAQRVMALVNRGSPGRATLLRVPRMNHHFELFHDARSAFDEEGGEYAAGATRQIVDWLRDVTR